MLLKYLKSSLSEHLCAVNILSGQKQYLNYHGWIFGTLFEHPERNSTLEIVS